ncbi:hypothetical protein MML48_10g00011630 [Holotrichia oblita]|uniref:Uncharacterized protein n=1 Tax=Holotrichia oblita TaxID=644536 RepID=A0ACB9SIA5_HOLOL|nr:hypothetical protein MML48_10g00011630 [Holotrichia oblita]
MLLERRFYTPDRYNDEIQAKNSAASWTEENMRLAVGEAEKSSIANTSRLYGIPLGTLHRHIRKGTHKKQLGRIRCIFSPDQERELSLHAKDLDNRFYDLTKEAFKEVAYKLASRNGIEDPFFLMRSANVKTATNGFRKCGIFPYNRDVFSDLDFASAEAYYIPPVDDSNQNVTEESSDDDIPLVTYKRTITVPGFTSTCNKSCHQSSEVQSEPGPSGISGTISKYGE